MDNIGVLNIGKKSISLKRDKENEDRVQDTWMKSSAKMIAKKILNLRYENRHFYRLSVGMSLAGDREQVHLCPSVVAWHIID